MSRERSVRTEWQAVAVDGEPTPEDFQPCIEYAGWTDDRDDAFADLADMLSSRTPYTDAWVEERQIITTVEVVISPVRYRTDPFVQPPARSVS